MRIEIKLKIVAGMLVLMLVVSFCIPFHNFDNTRPSFPCAASYSDDSNIITFDEEFSPVMLDIDRSAVVQTPTMNIPMQSSDLSIIVNEIKDL